MLEGNYYLEGVTEVASALRLNADHTFNFFFSSGGIDRIGKGTWTSIGDNITLNSGEAPAKSFKMISSKKTGDHSTNIKITGKNKMILGYVAYQIKTANQTIEGITNEEGMATLKKEPVESISLTHQLWPDKAPSVFEINDKEHNFFELGIEPSIAAIDFNNLKLTLNNKCLTGGHPLMPREKFIYKKDE